MFHKVYGSLFAAVLAGLATCASAETLQTSAGPVTLTKMADGLDVPWGFDFLPDQSVLITDRSGSLYRLTKGALIELKGVPKVAEVGQGGLLDVLVPHDFPERREILLTLSRATKGGAGTAVVAARLSKDLSAIEQTKLLLQVKGAKGGRHFGSRLVEAADGSLFVTSGERGDRPSAQDNRNLQGAILRINRDGSPHQAAPFANSPDARDEIWSYGHRNPQGLAIDAQGTVWTVEHGARGGDEINRIQRGANYGWPIIAYGRNYSGTKIGEGQVKEGMEQPAFYWDPSIAPSGMMIYSGALWPEWKGDFFVGSLKFDYIARLDGTPMQEREQIRHEVTGRIRDVREAPDGSIWFASEIEGALFRITPAH